MSNLNDPLVLGFESLRCIKTTPGPGDDEPYCVFFAVDNASTAPLPKGIASRTEVFDDDNSVGEGDRRAQWLPLWGLNGSPSPIASAGDVIVLAGLMEHDDSDVDALNTTVQALLAASLAAAKSVSPPLSRPQLVGKLIQDMFGALGMGLMAGGLNHDERIGVPLEVSLTANDLSLGRWGRRVLKTLVFESEDGAKYEVNFAVLPVLGWSGWEDLGGSFQSGPAAAAWDASRLDVFAKDASGNLGHLGGSFYEWGGWEKGLGNKLGAQFKDSPAAVSWGSGRIDVFVRGTDDKIGHAWWSGSQWHGWEGLGSPANGPVTSGPAAAAWGPNHLQVFVRGADSSLWRIQQRQVGSKTSWSPWVNLGGNFKDAPAAVSWGEDLDPSDGGPWHHTHIFVRGMDDKIGHLRTDPMHPNQFLGWQGLGHPPSGGVTSGPAVASWADGRLDVFVKGGENSLWHTASTDHGATWSNWGNLGGNLKDAPAAVSPNPNRIEVFARGANDHLYRRRWLGAFS